MLTYETPLYDEVLGRSYVNNTYKYGSKRFNEKETSGGSNTVYNNMHYKIVCDKCKGKKIVQ